LERQSESARSLPVLQRTTSISGATHFVSQPPRKLRVEAKGISHNALVILWEPPIFTGSNVIFDYELSYSVCHSKIKHGEVQRDFDPQPPLRLSRWCLQKPVPESRFRLAGLHADQEYGELSICAITAAGRSEPSNNVDIVQTEPAVPPTIPLFFCVGVVTATSITMTWVEPLDDGGKPILDYEVIFSEAVIKLDSVDDRGKGWLDVSEIEYKPRRIRANSTRTALTITNLLSGVEHHDFQVRAVNADGIPGDYCAAIKTVFTIGKNHVFVVLRLDILTHCFNLSSPG